MKFYTKLKDICNRHPRSSVIFIVAVLVFANLRQRTVYEKNPPGFFDEIGDTVFIHYGWPFTVVKNFEGYSRLADDERNEIGESIPRALSSVSYPLAWTNFGIAFIILVVTYFFCRSEIKEQ